MILFLDLPTLHILRLLNHKKKADSLLMSESALDLEEY